MGLGVKVILFANNEKQFQELTLTRGFQSSVAPQMNFGIGKAENIDSIKVIWPDRNYQIITNVSANSILVISHSESRSQLEYTGIKSNKILKQLPRKI